MFFFVACFYFFFQAITKDKKNWYLCGLFFGLSLLTKGPVAFLLPICMFLSLIFSKSLKQLKLITPWLGLLLGLVVFSVWPITLYINDKFYIYEQWFDFTFIHTIKDSRGDASPFYTYIVFLFKNAPLWFICSLVGSFYTLRTKNIFEICVLSFFWGIVVLLSLASFKYSNYLIPAYPFMAILAGIGVVNLIPKLYIDKFLNAIPYLFAVASLSLLIFPLTNKIRREKGVFKVKEVFKSVNFFPEDYYIVGGVYPYWNLNSLNAWENRNVITKSISAPDILRKSEDFCLSCSIFASQEVAEALVQKFETLGIVARLSRDNIFVIAPKKKISSNPIMVFKR
jgi:4-amino-4-deoxy-L-arabinose transferase-like glycosyltransferase